MSDRGPFRYAFFLTADGGGSFTPHAFVPLLGTDHTPVDPGRPVHGKAAQHLGFYESCGESRGSEVTSLRMTLVNGQAKPQIWNFMKPPNFQMLSL